MASARQACPPDRTEQGLPVASPVRAVPGQLFFVIPFAEYSLVEHLPAALQVLAQPRWINRGTGQPLRPCTVAMLLRTHRRDDRFSPSVERLRQWSGLRLTFASAQERHRFARAWSVLRGDAAAGAA